MWSSVDGANWAIVPQGQYTGFWAHGIASNGSELAVADTSYFVGAGEVLTSQVGQEWMSHTPGSAASMLDVHGDAEAFVAVGYRLESDHHVPAIWSSSKGSLWIDVSPESARGRLNSVVRVADGAYLAAGENEDGSIEIWRSDDRLEWVHSTLPSPGIVTGLWPQPRLVANGNRVVLMAYTVSGWWAWTSNDGRRWSEGQPIAGDASRLAGPYVAMANDLVIAFPEQDRPDLEETFMLIGRLTPVE